MILTLASQMAGMAAAFAQGDTCYSASATTTITLSGRFSSNAEIVPPEEIPATNAAGTGGANPSGTNYDDLEAAASYPLGSSMIYDSLGQAHALTYAFFRVSESEIEMRMYVASDETDPDGSTLGIPRQAAYGLILSFDSSGNLIPFDGPASFFSLSFNNGSAPLSISLLLGSTRLAPQATSLLRGSNGYATRKVAANLIEAAAAEASLEVSLNLDAASPVIAASDIPAVPDPSFNGSASVDFGDLDDAAAFSHTFEIHDPLGAKRTIRIFYFHTGMHEWQARLYIQAGEVGAAGSAADEPRQIGPGIDLTFNQDGSRSNALALSFVDAIYEVPWNGDRGKSDLRVKISATQLSGVSALCYVKVDDCPFDPEKTVPGLCGCGIPDNDTDFDGALDCNDGCPLSPQKQQPGVCGCGKPESDNDGDGALDCVDSCLSDPEKNGPGACGCGIPDDDSDSDGAADCKDECPSDPEKELPGECGCGLEDFDSDGDGSAECVDLCPADPDKSAPGECGCGIPDDDLDADGVADCLQPSIQTVPAAPVVTIQPNLVTVSLEALPGGPTYRLILQTPKTIITYGSRRSSVKLRGLAPGRYRIYYKAIFEGEGEIIETQPSAITSFTIRRQRNLSKRSRRS